jgi:signal transduction histidine kinase
MMIRNKLQIATIFSAIIGFSVVGVILFLGQTYDRAVENERYAYNLTRDLLELNSLTYAYALLQEERPKTQWLNGYHSLGRALSQHQLEEDLQRATLNRLQTSHALLKPAFDRVVAAVEKGRLELSDSTATYEESREGALAQLMVLSEQMVTEGAILESEARKEISQARSRFFMASLIAVLLLIAGIGTVLLLFSLTLTRSIKRLEEGARAFSKGDLSHRVAIRTKDEMGELAGTFNLMAENLARAQAELEKDIAKRRQVEHLLRQRNRDLQDFVFITSHDLQEPLRKLQVFGDRLKSMYGDVLEERGRDFLSKMISSAARMRSLILDLLKYNGITEKGESFTEVDLKKMLEETVLTLSARIEEAGGLVEVGDLPVIEASATMIGQLFQNLIENALKYRGEENPRVKVYSTGLTNGTCEILVEDNGIGFEEKYADLIFKPFKRLHQKYSYEGTGMGLAICRRIVERHGGKITARGTPGKGSTFIIDLPVNQDRSE